MITSLVFHFVSLTAASGVFLALQEKSSGSAGGVKDVSEMGDEFAASLNAKNVSRATSLYTEDAVLLPPNGEMIRGLAAIEACWKQLLEQGLSEIRSHSLASASSGDLGFETGEFEVTIRVPGCPVIRDRGKYLNVLKRGSDGRWRTAYDMWNSSTSAR